MFTEAVCSQLESHCCRIHGETFLFEVRSASIVAGRPRQVVLQVAAFRRTAFGPALAATVRVTAPLHELERVPALLTQALEEWLLCTAVPLTQVH
jgi:hypothetical protein